MTSRVSFWPSAVITSLSLTGFSALANPNDSLQLGVSYNVVHDDNLFRLQDKSAAPALVGQSSPAETIKSSIGSLTFEKEYGLQKIKLEASAVNYDYEKFSYLNFSALNYNGAVNWQFTPKLTGTLNASRQENVGSFGDFRNFRSRNRRLTESQSAYVRYELDGVWRLTGGFSNISVKNTDTFIEQRAFDIGSAEVGVLRLTPAGSQLSYRFRKGSGDYTAVSFANTALLPSRYDETENELAFLWSLSAKTQLQTRISYLQKEFNQFTFRNYSGPTGGVYLNWSPTARITTRFSIARDLSDFQGLYSNYSAVDKITIEPRWQFAEKLIVSFRQEYIQSRFRGAVPGSTNTLRRSDDGELTRVSLDWQPREFIAVQAWVQRISRDTNLPNFSYVSNSVGILGKISF